MCSRVARPLLKRLALASGTSACSGAVASAMNERLPDVWRGVSIVRQRTRLVTDTLAVATFALRHELVVNGQRSAPVIPDRIYLTRPDASDRPAVARRQPRDAAVRRLRRVGHRLRPGDARPAGPALADRRARGPGSPEQRLQRPRRHRHRPSRRRAPREPAPARGGPAHPAASARRGDRHDPPAPAVGAHRPPAQRPAARPHRAHDAPRGRRERLPARALRPGAAAEQPPARPLVRARAGQRHAGRVRLRRAALGRPRAGCTSGSTASRRRSPTPISRAASATRRPAVGRSGAVVSIRLSRNDMSNPERFRDRAAHGVEPAGRPGRARAASSPGTRSAARRTGAEWPGGTAGPLFDPGTGPA